MNAPKVAATKDVSGGEVGRVALTAEMAAQERAYLLREGGATPRTEGLTHARLIAAAPDNYAANVAMVDALNVAFGITSDHDDDYIYDTLPTSGVASAYFAARAAIARATGAAS